MNTFSLKDLENSMSNLKSAGANPDYSPPSMQWYNSDTLYFPEGIYFKAGPRSDQSYVDIDNMVETWEIENPIFFTVGGTYDGATGSGFLSGYSHSSAGWYSVWLVDVGGEPSPVLLPYLPVNSLSNPGDVTAITTTQAPTTTSGLLNGFRAIPYSRYLWEITDQKVLDVIDSDSTVVTLAGGHGAPFHGRWSPTYAQSDDSMWFFGGSDQFGTYYNDLWRFDFATEQWFKISTTGGPPTAVDRSSACYDPIADEFYIFAGYNGSYINQTWKCTFGANNTGVWSSGSSGGANEHFCFAYDASRRRLWVYGVFTGSLQDDLWYYDIDGAGSWVSQCTGCTPGNKRAMSMVYDPDDDCLILFGGYNNSTTVYNAIYKYDISGNSWSTISPTESNYRYWARAAYLDRKMYVVGGQNQEQQGTDSLLILDLDDEEWEHGPRYNSSTIRGGAIAVDTTLSGVYHFHGYDDWSVNRTVEGWKFMVNENEWRRVEGSAEIREGWGSMLQLAPPATTPCLYMGSVYLEADGSIRRFLKDGFEYTWFDSGDSNEYRIDLQRTNSATDFDNTDISVAIPPTAFEVNMSLTGGMGGTAARSVKISLCGNDAGGNLPVGFESPGETSAHDYSYRGTINLSLVYYNEHNYSWQSWGQSVKYMLACNQLLRNKVGVYNTTPTYGQAVIAGFIE